MLLLGRQAVQVGVVDGEVLVVLLQDPGSCALDAQLADVVPPVVGSDGGGGEWSGLKGNIKKEKWIEGKYSKGRIVEGRYIKGGRIERNLSH